MNKTELTKLIEAVNILQNECLLKKDEKMKIIKYNNKTIKPRANGSGYYTRYRDCNGQHSIYGKTAEEVLEKLKTALKELERVNDKSPRLIDWWDKWYEVFENDNIKESTKRIYRTIRKCYIVTSKIANLKINTITVFDVNEFLKSISSSRQRARCFDMLKRCFEKAHQLNMVKLNVFCLLQKPKHKKEIKEPFTEEEQIAFLNAVQKSKYKDLFLLMMTEGLRIGEALAITREDIDFDNRILRINKTLIRGELGTPKTDSSVRFLPIFDSSLEILSKYKGYRPEERIFNIIPWTASKHFKRVIAEAGLDEKFSTHCLRKTFGTRIYEAGVPIKQISAWLGHSDTAITEKCYIKILPTQNQKWLQQGNYLRLPDTQIDTQIAN